MTTRDDLERQLAEERERCARIAETLLEHTDGNIAHAAEAIAAAIRGGAKKELEQSKDQHPHPAKAR